MFFAADLICWHHAIADVGAGLATVLGNLQVAFVPLVAWAVLSERPGAACWPRCRSCSAASCSISGALEQGAYGDNPARGVALRRGDVLTYAGFILLSCARAAPTCAGPPGRCSTPPRSATAVVVGGAIIGDADLVPSWPAHGWLVLLASPRRCRLAADLARRCRACPPR